jgi:hypothetical protein
MIGIQVRFRKQEYALAEKEAKALGISGDPRSSASIDELVYGSNG